MNTAGIVAAVVTLLVIVFVIITVLRTVRVVPQARTSIVERLGRYSRTLYPGLNVVVPFVDRIRSSIDMREQVIAFPPQPVITSDNLTVSIDTVVYYTVTDPKAATYEIANFVQAMDLLAVTTLRNVIGGMHLEECLTSRDNINGQLRGTLDEATGKWGIRVNRVEIKAIDPPPTIREAMEKQMRAERERRAVILQAEGTKQAAILNAEGSKQSAILNAEAAKQTAILQAEGEKLAASLRADGQAAAIETVFDAVHRGGADPEVLAYQYLQMLPQLAAGQNKQVWVIPGELTKVLEQVTSGFAGGAGPAGPRAEQPARPRVQQVAVTGEHPARDRAQPDTVAVAPPAVAAAPPSALAIEHAHDNVSSTVEALLRDPAPAEHPTA